MSVFLTYLKVFAVGGGLCALGQLLINIASSGVTVPITGFGSAIAKGALEGGREGGLLGAVSGGLKAAAPGVSAVILFGFLFALVFRSRSKKV